MVISPGWGVQGCSGVFRGVQGCFVDIEKADMVISGHCLQQPQWHRNI